MLHELCNNSSWVESSVIKLQHQLRIARRAMMESQITKIAVALLALLMEVVDFLVLTFKFL